MLQHPTHFYKKKVAWNQYAKTLAAFRRSLPSELVAGRDIIIVSSTMHAGPNASVQNPVPLKSCHYLRVVSEYFRSQGAASVSTRINHLPDDD
ncbi:unnamed protein product, partial [Symbiodinium pilosum]